MESAIKKTDLLNDYFCREHTGIVTEFLEQWPNIELDERPEVAYECYRCLNEKMLLCAQKFNIMLTPEIRGKLLLDAFLNAYNFISNSQKKYKIKNLFSNRIMVRIEQILCLVKKEFETDAYIPVKFPTFVISNETKCCDRHWGEHGAHFPY